MNPIVYLVSLFYHWFSTKESTRSVAYAYSLIAFTAFLNINIMTMLIIFKMDEYILKFTKINNDTKYVLVLIGIIIGSFIISLLAPRKKIKSINYDLRDDTVDFVLFFSSVSAVSDKLDSYSLNHQET